MTVNTKTTKRGIGSGKGGPRDGDGKGASPLPKLATRSYETAPAYKNKGQARGTTKINKPMGKN